MLLQVHILYASSPEELELGPNSLGLELLATIALPDYVFETVLIVPGPLSVTAILHVFLTQYHLHLADFEVGEHSVTFIITISSGACAENLLN